MKSRYKVIFPVLIVIIVAALLFVAVSYLLYRSSQSLGNSQETQRVVIPEIQDNSEPPKQIIGGELEVREGLDARSLTITDEASFDNVSVSGELNASSIVLEGNPGTLKAGQLYKSEDGSLLYFDGRESINFSTSLEENKVALEQILSAGTPVTRLGGMSGSIEVGSGIEASSGRLTNSGVLSLQGRSGNVNLVAGAGIVVNGTTITNTGVTDIVSASSNLEVTRSPSGKVTIRDTNGGLGGMVALGPVAPQVDNGDLSSIWINKTGGGNFLQLSTGVDPVNRFVVDNSGAIVTGTIGFDQVTGKPAFVNSVDGVSGALSLGAGLTREAQTIVNSGVLSVGGLSGVVTLGNGLAVSGGQLVSTAGEGINSISGTANQVNVSGTDNIILSLPQDIAVTSTPTFAGINLNAPLTITSGGTGATTAFEARDNLGAAARGVNNDITHLNSLSSVNSVGNLSLIAGDNLALQGENLSLASVSGTNSMRLVFDEPTANVTYRLQAAAAGIYEICTTAGNCESSGSGSVTSINGSTGAITIAAADENSITTVGATITVSDASSSVKGLASFDPTNLVVVDGEVNTVQNLSVSSRPSFDGMMLTGASSLTLGSATNTGSILFHDGGSSFTAQLFAGSLSGNRMIRIPDSNGTIAVSGSGNIALSSRGELSLVGVMNIVNGGTNAHTASGARANLGAAASGVNNDITALLGLTSAISASQGGTGITAAPGPQQLLIGNGTGYQLKTLTAGDGINIDNGTGAITISAINSDECSSCANTSLSNLSSLAINTHILPGTTNAIDLGSSTRMLRDGYFGGSLQANGASFGQLQVTGEVLLKGASDSEVAFQVQRSDSTPLLVADTVNMQVVVAKLAVETDIIINGHIITGGNVPDLVPGSAACTAPTINVSGNDTAGTVTITSGSGCGVAGSMVNVSFNTVFGSTPRVMLTPRSSQATGLGVYVSSVTANGFAISSSSPAADATSYVFDYFVVQ